MILFSRDIKWNRQKRVVMIFALATLLACQNILESPQELYAEGLGSWVKLKQARLIAGIGLMAGGVYMTAHGFKDIPTFIPDPHLDLDYTSRIISWAGSSTNFITVVSGTARNTGNVNLSNIEIEVTYEGHGHYNYCQKKSSSLDKIYPGEEKDWSNYLYWGPTHYPKNDYFTVKNVNVTYEYDSTIEYENRNTIEGWIGIGLICGGTYLIYSSVQSYLKEAGYFSKLEKKGVEISLAPKYKGIYLSVSKKMYLF